MFLLVGSNVHIAAILAPAFSQQLLSYDQLARLLVMLVVVEMFVHSPVHSLHMIPGMMLIMTRLEFGLLEAVQFHLSALQRRRPCSLVIEASKAGPDVVLCSGIDTSHVLQHSFLNFHMSPVP